MPGCALIKKKKNWEQYGDIEAHTKRQSILSVISTFQIMSLYRRGAGRDRIPEGM